MGHLKDIKSNLDIQAFPGATFEIEGEVPASQCSEAKIEGNNATTRNSELKYLDDFQAFLGYDLTGKVCHITASVGGNTGDFDIIQSWANTIKLAQDPGNGDPVEYYISDGGELILTRDLKSFADFIHAAGYAYTIKGGKLYTNIPSAQLQPACSILFAPLT